jgi:ABC-2 type transport system ATP-binding protein
MKIERGCIYGLVGTNGSGKSTLLRLISGVYSANGGDIELDGNKVFENPEIKQRIFFVSDDLYFHPQATLDSMAAFYKAAYPRWNNERYNKLCELFPIGTKKKLSTFSKGMRRQAALILALSTSPDYLLLDEAFDGLDPLARLSFKRAINTLVEENGTSVIISSHSLRELEDFCDCYALIDKMTVASSGDIAERVERFCKFQLAFVNDISEAAFDGLPVVSIEQSGRFFRIVLEGRADDMRARLDELCPAVIEQMHMDFEEMFIHEVEKRGYLK